jgi:hypothetical protein
MWPLCFGFFWTGAFFFFSRLASTNRDYAFAANTKKMASNKKRRQTRKSAARGS